MKVKKIRYNSRSGYSVEWHDPHSIMISIDHARVLLAILLGNVTNEMMHQEFKAEEWPIIRRYEELRQRTIGEEGQKIYKKLENLDHLRKALMDRLTFFYESAVQQPITFQKEYLGWAEPSGTELVNRQCRAGLKSHSQRGYFEYLIKSLGMPSEKVMQQLEARFGTFNPKTGQFAQSR